MDHAFGMNDLKSELRLLAEKRKYQKYWQEVLDPHLSSINGSYGR
jgi:hypothetical protein